MIKRRNIIVMSVRFTSGVKERIVWKKEKSLHPTYSLLTFVLALPFYWIDCIIQIYRCNVCMNHNFICTFIFIIYFLNNPCQEKHYNTLANTMILSMSSLGNQEPKLEYWTKTDPSSVSSLANNCSSISKISSELCCLIQST